MSHVVEMEDSGGPLLLKLTDFNILWNKSNYFRNYISTAEEELFRGVVHVKSVESSKVFSLVWRGSQERMGGMTRSNAKGPRVAEQCDTNILSLTQKLD
ncbi:hypothetical protein TNCV_414061 [Trichonephila clavipes]|nr:hypothetical protein TNCV_414061 [Trichonephila clavipes]